MSDAKYAFSINVEHRVLCCRKCQICVWPHQLEAHLERKHRFPAWRSARVWNEITSKEEDNPWKALDFNEDREWPRILETPVEGIEPPILDAYQCTRVESCTFICKKSKTDGMMKRHWRSQHGWVHSSNRFFAREDFKQNTRELAGAQRFFRSGVASQYIEVLNPSPASPSSSPSPPPCDNAGHRHLDSLPPGFIGSPQVPGNQQRAMGSSSSESSEESEESECKIEDSPFDSTALPLPDHPHGRYTTAHSPGESRIGYMAAPPVTTTGFAAEPSHVSQLAVATYTNGSVIGQSQDISAVLPRPVRTAAGPDYPDSWYRSPLDDHNVYTAANRGDMRPLMEAYKAMSAIAERLEYDSRRIERTLIQKGALVERHGQLFERDIRELEARNPWAEDDDDPRNSRFAERSPHRNKRRRYF
ncbi:hypothetical protein N7454_001175 [Penicillium verhagenii]|nr:hypothetical protein N7454_001175 [Penicillium verhagenii]